MTEWITDRRPLPVDANDDDAVEVQPWPESTAYVYMARANVGLGTPWSHCHGWQFPAIRVGQVWRCEDGKERVVTASSNSSWRIGGFWYTSDGAPTIANPLTSIRLAELISEAKPSPIPPAILSGAEPFYVLVAEGDSDDVEPFVFETGIEAGSTLQAALDRRAKVGSRYGTTYVAQCRIVPSLTATSPNSEVS